MKITKLLVLFALGTASALNAPAFAKAGTHAGHHANALGLSKDQKTQLKPIRKNAKAQIKAIKADKTLSKKERHARIKAIKADSRTRMNTILTPAQQQQVAERRANHKATKRAHKTHA